MSFPARGSVFLAGAALALSVVAVVMAGRSLALDNQGDLIIRSTTRLVQMSVVAQDKQGRPVVDLKREDFELFDNGKRCPISIFVVEAPGIASQPQSVPRNTFTNQFARTAGVRSAHAVILLDWLNTGWEDQARTRQQVIRMLQRIEPNDRIALYVLDRKLKVISEFGGDTAALLEKLAALRADPVNWGQVEATGTDDASVSTLDGAIFPGRIGGRHHAPESDSPKEEQTFLLDQRVRETLRAFEEIAAHLASVPGRKTLIWVSAGFPLNVRWSGADGAAPHERDYTAEVRRIIQKLNNADVAVYPIDSRGLTASPTGYDSIWTMDRIASRTGGLAWYERNDLDVGMRTALDDIRFTYTIGFYPPADATHTFHKVRLQVRRHDVMLRYREGYYLDRPGEPYPQNKETEVTQALLSPVDSTAIPITIAATRKRDAVTLRLSVDAGGLDFVRENDRWHAKLELGVRFAAPDGNQVGSLVSQTAEFNMRPQAYEDALRNGLVLEIPLQILPNATVLKQWVRDVSSGKIGTLSIPLKMVTED
jgi:VWFA-related protein